MANHLTIHSNQSNIKIPSQSVLVPRQRKMKTIEAISPDLLCLPEVAEMLRLSRASVYRLVSRGKLPVHRLCRKMLFKHQDVLNCLEQGRDGGR
jgi:excisionase family DNA binding protein